MVVRPRGMANRIFTRTHAGRELSIVDEPEGMPDRPQGDR
jgi:hypothetical protein